MSTKKSSKTGKGSGMPGGSKTRQADYTQSDADFSMPGSDLSSGSADGGNNSMPRNYMSGATDDEAMQGTGNGSGDKDGGMPGHEMPGHDMRLDTADDGSNGMPGGSMNGDGGGGSGGDGGDGGDSNKPPVSRTCATMDVYRRQLSEFPGFARARDEIENLALSYDRGPQAAQRPGVTRIPVVVHVVWNTASQNISDGQISSQIDVLNRDFRRTNADVNNTPAPFLPFATDARIEFYLASADPNGAATSGIDRRQTTVTAFGSNDAVKSHATGGADAWATDRYLNMWVCQLSGGLLGYAQFPGGPAATDGVVILHSAFGTTGTAAPPFHLGRTATHEIGHWLNLNHIWGDDGTGCSGTDNVTDTPNQGGFNVGTPSFPHVSCGNAPNGDMFMNYMDYVDDPAMFMFSAGQVNRMQACLDGPRSSIGTQAGAPRPSSSPVVSWDTNRLDVFVTGSDRALYHKWWNGSAWGPSLTDYEYMGGVCTSSPQVVSWGPDRLDVFVTGTDSALYHKWWDGSAWGPSLTAYEYMGGICSGEPRIVSWAANRLDAFVLGSDHALYHKWWDGSSWGPSLTAYEYMGGVCLGQPEVVCWGPNRLDVFVIGTDRALYHKWWDGSSWGPSLTGYEYMGGVCMSPPRAVSWGANRLDVFVTGTDGALYHKWWDGSSWGPSLTGFEHMGGICVGQPEAVSWGANRLDVFVVGTDSGLYHKWWDGSAWGPSLTDYEAMSGIITSMPRVTAWGANRLDVFVTGTDSGLYHKWWDGSSWGPSLTGYESMGGIISSFRSSEKRRAVSEPGFNPRPVDTFLRGRPG